MYVWFYFKRKQKEDFITLPGLAALLQKTEDMGICWEYLKDCGDKPFEILLNGKEKESVVVTDDRSLSARCKESGICCIGYQKPEDTAYFSVVEAVISSFEELSPSCFLQCYHHFHRIPLEIARTQRLLIRESSMDDFEKLFGISREEGSDRYTETMTEDYDLEREKFRAYITHSYAFYGFGLWTVLEKETGEVLGRCGFSAVADDYSPEGRLELGYLIGKKYRNKGYALEACTAVMKYAEEILDGIPVYAVIHRDNLPSVKVVEKLGFQKQSHLSTEWSIYCSE